MYDPMTLVCFGYCPTSHGWGAGGPLYHSECSGVGVAASRPEC